MPGTNCQKAIQIWSEKNEGANPEEADVVKLLCLSPPIEKMDSSLNQLVNVRHLALSTNCIDKMISLPALKNIQILSLGRNVIKKITGLEEIGATLLELWISYNSISTLDGLQPCSKLQVLFMSNNKIKDWSEIEKLQANPELINVLFVGNPLYEGLSKKQARIKVKEALPDIKTVDGEMLTGDDDDDDELEGDGSPKTDGGQSTAKF
jgi:dynein light chain 1